MILSMKNKISNKKLFIFLVSSLYFHIFFLLKTKPFLQTNYETKEHLLRKTQIVCKEEKRKVNVLVRKYKRKISEKQKMFSFMCFVIWGSFDFI